MPYGIEYVRIGKGEDGPLPLNVCIRCSSRVRATEGTVCHTCQKSKAREKRLERAASTLGVNLMTVRALDARSKLRSVLERFDRKRRLQHPKRFK